MVEIHYHLLYGADDGPATLDDSIALAEASIADGTTHIVATPHSNDQYNFDPAANRSKLDTLQQHFGNRITLGLGCDFHFSYENITRALDDPKPFTINGGRYLLIEFADLMIPRNANELLYQLLTKGIFPIITHPERNPVLVQRPELLKTFIRTGCLVQVTASSFTGRFGKTAQKSALEMLQKNWINMLASDAHSLQHRRPHLAAAHQYIAKAVDNRTADLLCIEVPRAVFDNKPLPRQPLPLDLDEKPVKKKKNFFGFFSGH